MVWGPSSTSPPNLVGGKILAPPVPTAYTVLPSGRKAFNMAFFRRSADIFGLDIGSSGVKAVSVRESGGAYSLTSLGVSPLPPDVIADGTIKDPRTVVEAIKGAVSRAGLKGSSCAIAVCGRELIIKKVQIPEVPAKEVGDVVQLEAEHHVPFAIDEVFLDYQSIRSEEHTSELQSLRHLVCR